MLVPIASVDLFELSNNSVWRTNFGFKQAGHALPPWKEFEQESPGVLTEWGWLQFGFEMYYALLNCGFRMSPTAGTASGVHPVPLGYSRVYVHTGDEFKLDDWLDGLRRGRSFVTTGPMLTGAVNGELPGKVFQVGGDQSGEFTWDVEVVSPDPISRVEVIVNGQVRYAITPEAQKTEQGAWKWSEKGIVSVGEDGRGSFREPTSDRGAIHDRSFWVAVRTWSDQPDGRKRLHTPEPGTLKSTSSRCDRRYNRSTITAAAGGITGETARELLTPDAVAEFEKVARCVSSHSVDRLCRSRHSATARELRGGGTVLFREYGDLASVLVDRDEPGPGKNS